METLRTLPQPVPDDVVTSIGLEEGVGAFPSTAPYRISTQAWKGALALLLAGGTLTACGRLGAGARYRGPFGRYEAAHLLRRAAARGNAAEADNLASMGLERAVDALLDSPEIPEEHDPDYFEGEGSPDYRNAWVNQWLQTRTPAAERLTLFWHGHFVTEAGKTGWWNTYHKINKLRELSLSSFRDLLYMIAEDPAMLIYLDNNDSTKEHPNENWARELMELFTLGEGHYTEKDIQEVARAFTGWSVSWEDDHHYFAFYAEDHDFGPKTVLGRSVHNTHNPLFEGYEVLDILLENPQTYLFISEKLLKFYFHPDPDPRMVQVGADVLKGGTVRDFLKWLFMHPEFYADEARNALVKSPMEYAVGMLYAAGKREAPEGLSWWLRARLDQDPYNPPDVSGWPSGADWLPDALLLQRLKFIDFATRTTDGEPPPTGPVDYSVFMDGAANPLSLVAPEAQLL